MKACIDIGGTKVAVSLNTGAGLDLIARRSEPTAKTGSNDALAQQVIRLVDEACAEAGIAPHTVQRAGVSACGPFVMRAGQIELATPNICGGMAGPARGLPNDWETAQLEAPLLDLQRISLGGSVFVHNRDFLLPKLQAQLAGRLPALTAGCELVPAGLGQAVGDYAALALLV